MEILSLGHCIDLAEARSIRRPRANIFPYGPRKPVNIGSLLQIYSSNKPNSTTKCFVPALKNQASDHKYLHYSPGCDEKASHLLDYQSYPNKTTSVSDHQRQIPKLASQSNGQSFFCSWTAWILWKQLRNAMVSKLGENNEWNTTQHLFFIEVTLI